MIDAACVSSKSSPCASVPLTRIASGTGAVRVVPTTVHSPPPFPARSITAGAQSPRDDASAMPSTSSVRSRTLATTSSGSASNDSEAVKAARRSASVMAPMVP